MKADTDDGICVKLKNSPTLHANMVVMAIGVAPETTLAKDAGLELGIKGSIVVNDRMETSVTDIYAVGDAVQIRNFVTDTDALISLAGPANKQGRIAADNICGIDSRYRAGQHQLNPYELFPLDNGMRVAFAGAEYEAYL